MQEIQAIQASTHLADSKENTTHKSGVMTASVRGSETYQDDSTKVTLSLAAENRKQIEDIEAEQQVQEIKKVENQQIDYSLAMSGIPQYGGHLVTVVKYPDGRTEMVDAFSGKKVTRQDLALAQLAKESAQPAQQQQESIPKAANNKNSVPGESLPTDMD